MGGLRQIIRAGVTKRLDENPKACNFDRARRSYRWEQSIRQLLLTATYILGTILLYFLAIAYCMKDPKVETLVRGIIGAHAPVKAHTFTSEEKGKPQAQASRQRPPAEPTKKHK